MGCCVVGFEHYEGFCSTLLNRNLCIGSKMKREDQQDATIRCLLLTCLNMFLASLCPSSREQRSVTAFGVLFWFCWMWLVVVVGRCVIGCEHCRMWLVVVVGRCIVGCNQCSHPTTQRPTTTTNHIQQNQRSTPYAVTHGLCSPEDGHNDARNMLRQKLIIII